MIFESQTISDYKAYSDNVDIFVSASGSESRSTALLRNAKILANSNVIFLHASREGEIAKSNEQLSRDLASIILSERESLVETGGFLELKSLLECARSDSLHVTVDISCLTRTMLAEIVIVLRTFAERIRETKFVYLPAKYTDPRYVYPKIRRIGAAHPDLAGFNADPNLPLALVMGLGFEYGVALGLINQLEPIKTICAWAVGHDERFDLAVKRANFDFDFSPYKTSAIEYNMFDPMGTTQLLSDVVRVLSGQYRVVLVPMGPKIFSLAATVLSAQSDGEIALYRVEHGHKPVDVLPSGELIIARAHLA